MMGDRRTADNENFCVQGRFARFRPAPHGNLCNIAIAAGARHSHGVAGPADGDGHSIRSKSGAVRLPMQSNARYLASGIKMEFTALFLAITVVMIVAWRGSRPLALTLFAIVLLACIGTYLHHATDTLKLSF
jgi:hypothetical protein